MLHFKCIWVDDIFELVLIMGVLYLLLLIVNI